jgi:hypothetical protein
MMRLHEKLTDTTKYSPIDARSMPLVAERRDWRAELVGKRGEDPWT